MDSDSFCYFYKDSGKILYNGINLINNTKEYDVVNRMNSEVITDLEVYTDGQKYYHKSRGFDQEITDKYIYLEWKQTRKGDWDWFKTEINPLCIKCLKGNVIKGDVINNKLHLDIEQAKKLRNKQFRDEILEQINLISSKYTTETNKLILTSQISHILNKFEV